MRNKKWQHHHQGRSVKRLKGINSIPEFFKRKCVPKDGTKYMLPPQVGSQEKLGKAPIVEN
jgi:hypothetical protein